MAKEQNLSLNPSKISGNCGRLMCCLKNEEDAYEYLNSRLPGLGDLVRTPDGLIGEVSGTNVLKQRVKVIVSVNGSDGEEKEVREYAADDVKPYQKRRRDRDDRRGKDEEEGLRELERLEKKEGRQHLDE